MYDHGTSQDYWKLNTQQHVSLEKHRQMIKNTLRWQEACRLTNDQEKATAKPLHRRFGDLLYLVMSIIRVKEGQAHEQCGADIQCECLDMR